MINKEDYINLSQSQLNIAFIDACTKGQLNKIQYLLTSPDLKENAEINIWNHYGFTRAYDNNKLEVLQFLIIEMNIEETEFIKNYIKKYPNESVENMFKIRGLINSLDNELSYNKVNKKINKL